MANGQENHHTERQGEYHPTAGLQVCQQLIYQQTSQGDRDSQDSSPSIQVIVELRQEVTHQGCQSSRPLEIARHVFPFPKEYLVLLVIEEMVWIPKLEEAEDCYDSKSKYDNPDSHHRLLK
jgi:hypothetical protein